MEHLSGKVAVITGAASGIGLAMANRFGAAGMRLMIADIEAGPLADAAAGLRSHGYDVSSNVCDVADASAVQALADATMEAYDGVHVVCNNAGVGTGGPDGRCGTGRMGMGAGGEPVGCDPRGAQLLAADACRW